MIFKVALQNSFVYFAVISTVFQLKKNYVCIKNNKIAIKSW